MAGAAGAIYPSPDMRSYAGVTRQINTHASIQCGMSWFHFTKQERLKAEFVARRDIADTVRKSIRRKDFYALNPRLFDDAIHGASEVPYTFEEFFQEAAPQHFRKAAELEAQLWTKLRDAH